MIYRFDRYRLETGTRRLTLDGKERHLERRVYALLLFLIEHRERVVSRDELFERVWDGRAVSDWTLSTAISSARKAVGDNGRMQRLIRTVHGHGFRFVGEVETDDPAETPHPNGPELSARPSIAVLPFTVSGWSGSAADLLVGLSEDLAAALSRMRWLLVISSGSTQDYAAGAQRPEVIARELGVRYLLTGSVRQASGTLRITCTLSDAEDGQVLWSDHDDSAVSDVLGLQDRITARVAMTLSSEVTLAEIARAQRAHPNGLDAWRYYLQALPQMHMLTAEANDAAKARLAVSLERNADFAPAYAGLAWCYGYEAIHGWHRPGTVSLALAERYAVAALQLSGDEPRAHCAMALVHFLNGRQEEAVISTDRAIELDPNMPDAHGIRGNALAISGRPDGALISLGRALRGSPRDPARWFWAQGMANAHFSLEDYATGLDWARRAVEMRPGWIFGHLMITYRVFRTLPAWAAPFRIAERS